jgi:hypothetical protein
MQVEALKQQMLKTFAAERLILLTRSSNKELWNDRFSIITGTISVPYPSTSDKG